MATLMATRSGGTPCVVRRGSCPLGPWTCLDCPMKFHFGVYAWSCSFTIQPEAELHRKFQVCFIIVRPKGRVLLTGVPNIRHPITDPKMYGCHYRGYPQEGPPPDLQKQPYHDLRPEPSTQILEAIRAKARGAKATKQGLVGTARDYLGLLGLVGLGRLPLPRL